MYTLALTDMELKIILLQKHPHAKHLQPPKLKNADFPSIWKIAVVKVKVKVSV